MDTTETTETASAESAYVAAYNDALAALRDVGNAIHDLPATGGETKIDWANVGDMRRFAEQLKNILAK